MAKSKKSVKKAGSEPKDVTSVEQLKKLGDRIRTLRIRKGYSNYENFAFIHEIPRAQFGRYERGEDLRFTSLIKVLGALDVSIKEFFSEGFE